MDLNNDHKQREATNSNSKAGVKRNNFERENEGHFWLHKISEGKKTAEELVVLIVSQIEAQPVYYKNVRDMCRHLDKIMRFFYRDITVKVTPFGSADTRLAIRDSDVDIFLDFGGTLPEPPKKLLISLKNKVRKYGYFIKTFPIFARTPIIQCVHCSGVSCDLSFVNFSAVSNSQLIKFLLSLDVRIRPLVLLLKYLLKAQGLIGPHALTSYALVLLILFFLQTAKNPLIPSVKFLQNLAAKQEIIADWDASFTTEKNHLPGINNNLSVTDLLHNFFQFYATFEFGFYVISLFMGKFYLKPIFSDPDLLPEEFCMYKKNMVEGKSEGFEYKKFMCVQDPFNHSINVTRNTTQKSLIQFQKLCSTYAGTGQKLWDNRESEEKKFEYLIHLFDHKVAEPKTKKLMVIEPVINFVGQDIIFDDPNCTEDDLRSKWSEKVFNSVIHILRKIMKCELEIHCKEIEGLSTSDNIEKIINCEFHYLELVTKKRNEAKSEFEFPSEMSILDQEEMISNYLYDTVLKDATRISLKFDISCTTRKGPTCFCLSLDSKDQKKSNTQMIQQVFKFIQNSFVKWIK